MKLGGCEGTKPVGEGMEFDMGGVRPEAGEESGVRS